jgi:predicted site-specific integrase-resolvase
MAGRWLDKRAACSYAQASKRMLEGWMKAGLRYSKLPSGTVRIHTSAIDEYLRRFERGGPSPSVRAEVDRLMENFK